MDENFSWKIIYIATIFSLLVLGGAYFWIAAREAPYASLTVTDRIAEFKDTRVTGRQDGKTVWEMRAASGWTDKAQEVTYLNNISQGKIFNKQGRLILTNLSAPRAETYRHSEIIEAFGPVKARLDLKKNEWTSITSQHIKFIPDQKRSELDGAVTLATRQGTIHSTRLLIDHDKKVANFPEPSTIRRRDGDVKANTVEYLGESEQINADGAVDFNLKESRIRTELKCDRSTLYLDLDKNIDLDGDLNVVQGKKFSIAKNGTYSRLQHTLFLRGGTRTIMEKAQAIFDAATLKELQSQEEKKLLKAKTVVVANEIFFSLKTGDARATGSVEVTQQGRVARSDAVDYDDKSGLMTLTGNVTMKKAEAWISCRQVIVSIKKETFEAFGVKESEFRL